MAHPRKTARNAEILKRSMDGEPLASIAADFGITYQRVQQIVSRLGYKPGQRSGDRHPYWTGGRVVTAQGYIRVLRPEHPRADAKGYVAEHVLVAEEKIGRPIGREEHVHHINGVKDDNRPENLTVMSSSAHMRLHNPGRNQDLLLDWLRWLALRQDRTPACHRLHEHLPAWHMDYYRHFRTYGRACLRAGLLPNGVGKHGHGGEPLPEGFREKHGHLLMYRTPEDLAAALYGSEDGKLAA